MRKIIFLILISLVLCSSNMSFSAETEDSWIYSSTERNLSFQWNFDGLMLPLKEDDYGSFWAPTPERSGSVAVNLKIPTHIFSDVPYITPTPVENEKGEFELVDALSNPMDDESISISIIMSNAGTAFNYDNMSTKILFSKTILEKNFRASAGDGNYTVPSINRFVAFANHWSINYDSIYLERYVDASQNIQISVSRSGLVGYQNSDRLSVSCLLTPKTPPWNLGYYDGGTFDVFPNNREIPLNKFVVFPDGFGFLSEGETYDTISLSKKAGSAINIKKELNGSMLNIIPDNPLEYDTEYELTIPKDSLSGITFNNSSLDQNSELPNTTINFNTQSVIQASYVLGYNTRTNMEKATPLRLKFESIFDDIKISNITIVPGHKSIFSVIENGKIVSEPSMKYNNVKNANFDFNQIDISDWVYNIKTHTWQYLPHCETITAMVTINENGKEKTIKVPIEIVADSLYNIYVMESGDAKTVYDGKGQVLLGDKPLEKRVPYKVMDPNIRITLPNHSRIFIKFIDGTIGSIKIDTDTVKETVHLRPNMFQIEPIIRNNKNENGWKAICYKVLENETTNKAVDTIANFIFKNPFKANAVGLVVGIFTSPSQLGGSIINTRIKSSVVFSLSEKKGITFSNLEGTPEILLDNNETILVPEDNQILIDINNSVSNNFSEIDENSNVYQLNDEMVSDSEILDQSSFIYVCSNGLIIESFSRHWWDDKKIESLYQELLSNDHGDEINSLTAIKIYPDKGFFHEKGRALGYYLTDKKEIHLNFGDLNTTVNSMARTLSHEYGHHYTIQLCKENENIILGETNLSDIPYLIVRNIANSDFVQNNYDNGHAWNIKEIAAEDYVQLLGSEKANNLNNNKVQENQMIPIASDIPKLESYLRNLGNLPDKIEVPLEKPVLKVLLVENSELGYKNLKFSWNSIEIDSPVSYMLKKVKENNIYVGQTVSLIEDSSLENFEITAPVNIVGSETIYVLYGRDKNRNTVSSNLVTVVTACNSASANCLSLPNQMTLVESTDFPSKAVIHNDGVSLDIPAYCKPVDIYIALFNSAGELFFVDSNGNLAFDFIPYGIGRTSAVKTSVYINDSQLITDKCTLYWLIAPANGGNFAQSVNDGLYELGVNEFDSEQQGNSLDIVIVIPTDVDC